MTRPIKASVGALLDARVGVLNRVLYEIDHGTLPNTRGRLNQRLGKWLRDRGYNADARTIRTLADRVIAGRDVAGQLGKLPDDEKVARGDVPVNPSIGDAYELTVLVAVIDPRTGELTVKSVTVHSDRNLTRGEWEELVKEEVETMFEGYMNREHGELQGDVDPLDIQWRMMQRRTR